MKRWFSITIFGIIVIAGIGFGVFGFMNVLSF
jgi:hypothetical protein